MILAALRRLAILILLSAGITVVISLLLGTLAGSSVGRSLALGFYLMGCFLLVAGFFTGNRGPARVKSESAGPMILPLPFFGPRRLRWATPTDCFRRSRRSFSFRSSPASGSSG